MATSTFLNYILVIDTGSISVVSILFQNLDDFLETAQKNKRYWSSQYSYIYIYISNSNNTRPGSVLWSGQVSQLTGSTNTPISITFSVDNVSYDLYFLNFAIYKKYLLFYTKYTNISQYICVY